MVNTHVHRTTMLLFLLLLSCSVSFAQSQTYQNDYGWAWVLEPAPPPRGMTGRAGFLITANELKNGHFLLTVAYAVQIAKGLHSLRAVAFDSSGGRFEFDSQGSVTSNDITLRSFRLTPTRLPANLVKFVGIEQLTEENLRTLLAPAAFKKLKDAAQQALPYPEIGKSYQFELVAIDGKAISSRALLGKVVLLDFWASWCSPCMAKMPKLKELHAKFKQRGFEVIGLNHDNSLETAQKYTTSEKLPWPNVLAPTSEDYRSWWETASGISTLPRLLLVDRKGVLRADVFPHQLAEELERLIAE